MVFEFHANEKKDNNNIKQKKKINISCVKLQNDSLDKQSTIQF